MNPAAATGADSNPAASTTPALILASGSVYRRQLLQRLQLSFSVIAPNVDEQRLTNESPRDYVTRLAQAKAAAVAASHGEAWVIGSDQTAVLKDADGDQILGKPGSHDQAIAQLQRCSGREVRFLTSLCLLPAAATARHYVDVTRVQFRQLSAAEIERYVAREQPLDCAGSFKAEALGISLFDAIHSDDPSALIGLPLIALCRLLRQAGMTLP
ncbi:MAG: Maf family protein [Wenzhouxiangellaceae bacterium]